MNPCLSRSEGTVWRRLVLRWSRTRVSFTMGGGVPLGATRIHPLQACGENIFASEQTISAGCKCGRVGIRVRQVCEHDGSARGHRTSSMPTPLPTVIQASCSSSPIASSVQMSLSVLTRSGLQ